MRVASGEVGRVSIRILGHCSASVGLVDVGLGIMGGYDQVLLNGVLENAELASGGVTLMMFDFKGVKSTRQTTGTSHNVVSP